MNNAKPDIRKHDIYYFRKRIKSWGQRNQFDYPWRNTDNLWHAIVAEIMLQRTRAGQVLPIYEEFTSLYPTPQRFVADHKVKEVEVFNSLGLRWRNRVIIETAQYLSKIGTPLTFEELLKVPGIGDYIAAAVASFHLGLRTVLIDSNIVRFYGRFWGFETIGELRRKKWFKEFADLLTPEESVKEYNYSVLDFSMNICRPKPTCDKCNLSTNCSYSSNISLYETEPDK